MLHYMSLQNEYDCFDTIYNLSFQEIIYEMSVSVRFYIQQTCIDFTHTCIPLLNNSTGNYSRKGK